jgi:hypothetical protein
VRLDLHRHLEGSHGAEALLSVARDFGIGHPLLRDEAALRRALVLTEPSEDAGKFYACIQVARLAYVHADAVGALAHRAFVEAAAECDGFEMRVSLFSMTRAVLENQGVSWRELSPMAFAEHARTLLLQVLGARDRALRETGIPMLVRLGFSRAFEAAEHQRAVAGVVAEHAPGLSGLDILGIVKGEDTEPLPPALLDIVSSLRRVLPDLTIHAGEFAGHASVDRTLGLEPQAIGHGIRSVESGQTLDILASRGVTLEVCPCSNRLLIPGALARVTAQHGAHPLVVLQRAGVHAVLGSDDPAPMGTDFRQEWSRAAELGADLARLETDMARRWAQLQPKETSPRASA